MAEFIDYNKVIDQAMRSIVKKCLKYVLNRGSKLPGNHHFYITFNIDHPDVEISDTLAKMHSEQMTIVMQHQFWDLEVNDKDFSVTLSFNNIREKLTVPYDALISFADPSARFGLQFHDDDELILPEDDEEIDDELLESLLELDEADNSFFAEEEPKKKSKAKKKSKKSKDAEDDGDKVISIDSFRKK